MTSECLEAVYESDNTRSLPVSSSVNIYKHYHNEEIYVNEDLKSAYSSHQSYKWKNCLSLKKETLHPTVLALKK